MWGPCSLKGCRHLWEPQSREVREHREGYTQLGSPHYSYPALMPYTSRSSYLQLTASQNNGFNLLDISHPVSPPRQFGDEQRLIICQQTSRYPSSHPSPAASYSLQAPL